MATITSFTNRKIVVKELTRMPFDVSLKDSALNELSEGQKENALKLLNDAVIAEIEKVETHLGVSCDTVYLIDDVYYMEQGELHFCSNAKVSESEKREK